MGPPRQARSPAHERPQGPNLAILFRRRRQEGAALMPEAALALGPEPEIAWFAEATARVWRGEPGNPRRGRIRSGFVQGPASLFPGRSASRPPPGIFLPSVAGSPTAYMMPGPIRSPSVHLIRVLGCDSALRQRGNTRLHRGPRPGKREFTTSCRGISGRSLRTSGAQSPAPRFRRSRNTSRRAKRRRDNIVRSAKTGRDGSPPEARSSATVAQPAALSSRSCDSSVCSPVEARACPCQAPVLAIKPHPQWLRNGWPNPAGCADDSDAFQNGSIAALRRCTTSCLNH